MGAHPAEDLLLRRVLEALWAWGKKKKKDGFNDLYWCLPDPALSLGLEYTEILFKCLGRYSSYQRAHRERNIWLAVVVGEGLGLLPALAAFPHVQ